MNLLEDIKNIVSDNEYHSVKVQVDTLGVSIYLDYDPELNYEERCLIPIRYDTLDEFAYIPDDEYREKFNIDDFGIDIVEITLILKIMTYLESHKEDIDELCTGLSHEWRKEKLAEKEAV